MNIKQYINIWGVYMRYDSIIIGSGPAGLSAAINLKIHNKNILWFGNNNLSAYIRVHSPSVSRLALRQLWIHPIATGTEQLSGK